MSGYQINRFIALILFLIENQISVREALKIVVSKNNAYDRSLVTFKKYTFYSSQYEHYKTINFEHWHMLLHVLYKFSVIFIH